MGRASRWISRGLDAYRIRFLDLARRHLPKQVRGDFDRSVLELPLFEHVSQQRKLQRSKPFGPVESQLGRYFDDAADVLRQHDDFGQLTIRRPPKQDRLGFPAGVPRWRFTTICMGAWLSVDSRSKRLELFGLLAAKSSHA